MMDETDTDVSVYIPSDPLAIKTEIEDETFQEIKQENYELKYENDPLQENKEENCTLNNKNNPLGEFLHIDIKTEVTDDTEGIFLSEVMKEEFHVEDDENQTESPIMDSESRETEPLGKNPKCCKDKPLICDPSKGVRKRKLTGTRISSHKGHSCHQWSQDAMYKAVDAVLKDNWTVFKASNVFEVPYNTLNRRIKGDVKMDHKLGNPLALTTAEEETVVRYITDMTERGFTLSGTDVRKFAFQLGQGSDRPKRFKSPKQTVTYCWYKSFLNRHNISLKSVDSPGASKN